MATTTQPTYYRQDKETGQITQVDRVWVAKALGQVHNLATVQAQLNDGAVLENTIARFAAETDLFEALTVEELLEDEAIFDETAATEYAYDRWTQR